MSGLYSAVIGRVDFLSQFLGLQLIKFGNSQVKELMISPKQLSFQYVEVLFGSEMRLLFRQKRVKILQALLPKRREGP